MNLEKFRYSFNKYGFTGFFNTLFGKIGIKYRLQNHISRIINYYSKEIEKISKNKIMYGNYKGTKMLINKSWNSYDLPSKYLGTYELEVQNLIIQSQKKNKKKYFINLGCGEGYHAICLMKKKVFQRFIGFEASDVAQSFLKKNLSINKMGQKAIIFKKENSNFLNNKVFEKYKLKDSFFLIDIEGAEFQILNPINIKKLRKSKLIIEIHDFYKNPKNLIRNLKKFFRLKTISTENRNIDEFKILEHMHDNEKWLLMSEGRPKKMEWIFCEPK